ncbi:MAG: M20/M25/M40 family metallo-hydrolase [Negativicutes bacterium]|nr:M20/M25/M40 family metallo-hydrolase [Negativicutes bacterium]
MKEKLRSYLNNLMLIPGVSGQEQRVVKALYEKFLPLADSVEVDAFGNLIAVKKGKKAGPNLMITAHSDEIGAIVKSVEKSGFIRFEKIGGTVDSLLLGRQIGINGHFGVVGVKAGHLMSEKEKSEVIKHRDLYIDIGANSDAEVAEMGIKIGDPIYHWPYFHSFSNTDRVCGKALDDRIGCAVMLVLFEQLQTIDFAGTLYGVITVQEEVGLRGAQMVSNRLKPDFAIALDTMPAGDTPDVNYIKELPVAIGKGPVIQVLSGSGARGMLLNPIMKHILIQCCEKAGVPYQQTVFIGGNTDAAAIHLAGHGIVTGALTIPRRYSHSPIEVMDLNDAAGTVAILLQIVRDIHLYAQVKFVDTIDL